MTLYLDTSLGTLSIYGSSRFFSITLHKPNSNCHQSIQFFKIARNPYPAELYR